MSNIIKTIYGRLLDWSGLANVPAALKALAGLKGNTGQIIEISGTGGDGIVSAMTAVDKPAGNGATVPTKVSAFENDAGYTTEARVQELLAAFPTFDIQVVAELPAVGAEKTIYLVPFASEDGQYLEYLYVDGAWEVVGNGKGSGENITLSAAQINALDGMFKVVAYDSDADYSGAYVAFCAAFGLSTPDSGDTTAKTLTSISATYSGGSVPVGTAVSGLSEVIVTAHYSDGSTATVTGYTLSGSIAEGENTVTVTYQGKTATFTVTGTAETGGDDSGGSSGGEETGVSNESTWTNGVAYTFEPILNEYVETDGTFTTYNDWNRTPYLYCKDAAVLRVVVNDPTSMLGNNNSYNAFFDSDKNFVERFSFAGIDGNTAGAYMDIEVPANAAYFVASHKAGVIGSGVTATNALSFVPYSEVPV